MREFTYDLYYYKSDKLLHEEPRRTPAPLRLAPSYHDTKWMGNFEHGSYEVRVRG